MFDIISGAASETTAVADVARGRSCRALWDPKRPHRDCSTQNTALLTTDDVAVLTATPENRLMLEPWWRCFYKNACGRRASLWRDATTAERRQYVHTYCVITYIASVGPPRDTYSLRPGPYSTHG